MSNHGRRSLFITDTWRRSSGRIPRAAPVVSRTSFSPRPRPRRACRRNADNWLSNASSRYVVADAAAAALDVPVSGGTSASFFDVVQDEPVAGRRREGRGRRRAGARRELEAAAHRDAIGDVWRLRLRRAGRGIAGLAGGRRRLRRTLWRRRLRRLLRVRDRRHRCQGEAGHAGRASHRRIVGRCLRGVNNGEPPVGEPPSRRGLRVRTAVGHTLEAVLVLTRPRSSHVHSDSPRTRLATHAGGTGARRQRAAARGAERRADAAHGAVRRFARFVRASGSAASWR